MKHHPDIPLTMNPYQHANHHPQHQPPHPHHHISTHHMSPQRMYHAQPSDVGQLRVLSNLVPPRNEQLPSSSTATSVTTPITTRT